MYDMYGANNFLDGLPEYDEELYGGATDEEIEAYENEEYRKKLNLTRDERGRLSKGATIAKKRSCDEEEIWYLHKLGWTVKKIVEVRGCSKSTAYNVIKKKKQKDEGV